MEEWIDAHQKLLRYAYDKSGERSNDRAKYRKTVHDHKRFNPELYVGDKVYIRNRGVRGRNNIEDTWDSTIYRVLRLSENTVVVEPDDGAGVSRTLNRQHVIKCNVPQCVDRNIKDSDSSDSSETMLIPRRTKRLTAGKHFLVLLK